MKPELSISGIGICVSSLFGAVVYYTSGDILGAIVAGSAWAVGFALFVYFIHTYNTRGDIWKQNTGSTVTQLLLYSIIFAAMMIEITNPITVMSTMIGVAIAGYMAGVLALAESHPGLSRSE